MEGALVMVRILPRLLNPFFDPEVITPDTKPSR